MSEAPGDASLSELVSRDDIARLAELYDRFAHAWDPFSEDSDTAEAEFHREIANLFDLACYEHQQITAIGVRAFRREIIKRCRRYLRREKK